jgi:hypothetical protein
MGNIQMLPNFKKPEDFEVSNTILRWVVWAERPLTLHELTVAIAIRPGQRSMDALSEMTEPDLGRVLRSVLGAMVITQNNEVHIIHQSAKDFLKGWKVKDFFCSPMRRISIFLSVA